MHKKRRRLGMKIGHGHKWKYSSGIWKETKITPKSWKFTFTNSKTRAGHSAPYGTGMPIGSKLIWRIKANQYAIKTSPNTYQLIMKGKKTMGRWKTPYKKKWGK